MGKERRFVRCKAGLVDAVIYVIIGPFVRLVDLCPQILRIQVHVLVLFRKEVIEFCVEHADDLAGFIADNLILLDIIQSRDGKAAFVFRVDFKVDVT